VLEALGLLVTLFTTGLAEDGDDLGLGSTLAAGFCATEEVATDPATSRNTSFCWG
jgi:hypothetical protein